MSKVVLYEYKVDWSVAHPDYRSLSGGYKVSKGSQYFFNKPDKNFNGKGFIHNGNTVYEVYIPIAGWTVKKYKYTWGERMFHKLLQGIFYEIDKQSKQK